jgi:hypothetical protein
MFTSLYGAPVSRLLGIFPAGCLGCLLLSSAILLWPPSVAYAQTEAKAPEEPAVQEAETEAVETEREEAELKAEESEPIPIDPDKIPGRFIPSEEISEDWSVTFPVDI